jgi:transposase InsO family protein
VRRTFTRWGLPGSIRVDNGSPWGSTGEWPTALALWLIGLGVGVIWNNPRRPQENGVIERSQGTADRWSEPWTCDSPRELQTRLERMDQLYREAYPYRAGQSRAAIHPGLAHSGRPYSVESEDRLWDWSRVTAHLSDRIVVRRVDQSGLVSLYNRGHYVGKLHQGKDVYVTYDPELNEWIFTDATGCQVRSQPATQLTPERVKALTVSDPN